MGAEIYLVMRDEGIRSDGYYYESNTSVVGIRTTEKQAFDLLAEVAHKLYPEKDAWSRSEIKENIRFQYEHRIVEDIYDVLWIERRMIGKDGDIKIQ